MCRGRRSASPLLRTMLVDVGLREISVVLAAHVGRPVVAAHRLEKAKHSNVPFPEQSRAAGGDTRGLQWRAQSTNEYRQALYALTYRLSCTRHQSSPSMFHLAGTS